MVTVDYLQHAVKKYGGKKTTRVSFLLKRAATPRRFLFERPASQA